LSARHDDSPATWDHGGYPFGLEPLVLPARWAESKAPKPVPADLPTHLAAFALGQEASRTQDLVPSDSSAADQVFWFRWITGHQACFVLWHLLAGALAEYKSGTCPEKDALERMRLYIRGYSLLLLYSGSCPRSQYNRIIRSPMARQHKNISGLWALDYVHVRDLLHRKIRFTDSPLARQVAYECDLNERVHQGVAFKLVPSGVSLLRTGINSENSHYLKPTKSLSQLYDCTFLTIRQEVGEECVVGQLVHRLRAFAMDVGTNSLYPAWAPSQAEELTELSAHDIQNSITSFVRSLVEISRCAAGKYLGSIANSALP
jgi:hypothetical protein